MQVQLALHKSLCFQDRFGEELQNLGISVIRDLGGVGKNLQDHLQARPIFKTIYPL